jgi:hypothetical protein
VVEPHAEARTVGQVHASILRQRLIQQQIEDGGDGCPIPAGHEFCVGRAGIGHDEVERIDVGPVRDNGHVVAVGVGPNPEQRRQPSDPVDFRLEDIGRSGVEQLCVGPVVELQVTIRELYRRKPLAQVAIGGGGEAARQGILEPLDVKPPHALGEPQGEFLAPRHVAVDHDFLLGTHSVPELPDHPFHRLQACNAALLPVWRRDLDAGEAAVLPVADGVRMRCQIAGNAFGLGRAPISL